MLTIAALRDYGANTDDGLRRCMNNESFYLRLVGMALKDGSFDRLRDALLHSERKAAFEAAHALKGALGNLGLTPLYAVAVDLTEELRGEGELSQLALLLGGRLFMLRNELEEIAE